MNKYYENTKGMQPHELLVRTLALYKNTGIAIDLGCGAGRDTLYLASKRVESICSR